MSRASDYILYNVEASAIDKVVEMYGQCMKLLACLSVIVLLKLATLDPNGLSSDQGRRDSGRPDLL